MQLPLVLIVLAVATLLASVARTVVTFARVRDMAVIRQQSMTDDLTGVANRRELYQQVDRSLAARRPATSAPPEGVRRSPAGR